MEHTPHIFLSGEEAEAFAVRQGHTLVADNAHFTTTQRLQQWERYKDAAVLAPADEIVQQATHNEEQQQQRKLEDGQQTVGAVAIDVHGCLAAATSTGGRTNKWDGRIGECACADGL
jgi:beta-aspartyl-peptidase (threonine type)